MFTKEKKTEKICSFYASDYHLEMIMIPYINRKMNEQANIRIITEKNLKPTINDVIARVNIPKNRKDEILNLNWDNSSKVEKPNIKKQNESIIFIVGSKKYIDKTNEKIKEEKNINPEKIIDCYSIEEVQENITEIVLSHSKVLNTIDEKEIK